MPWPKYCEYDNKDEDRSLNTLNDKNGHYWLLSLLIYAVLESYHSSSVNHFKVYQIKEICRLNEV